MLLHLLLSALLTGTPIGSSPSVDYDNNSYPSTTTKNIPADAFDGNMNTFFASYERNYTWVGLDLGSAYVIDRVGWSPRNDGNGPRRMVLGVFEGANRADFLDAVPLYVITEQGVIGQMSYADVHVTKGFRYVRYVGPNNARCNVAELAFYGTQGNGATQPVYYRPGNLPVVMINTVNSQEPYDKEHDIPSRVVIIDTDNSILTDSATSRLRGNASMGFEKKPYRIKFDSKQTPLDAVANAKKWTLINNYGDKSLIRNLLAFEISRKLGLEYTPYGRLVDVFLNGEYKGVYQLCDQIEQGVGRVDIEKLKTTDISGENLTGGYLLEIDAYADQEPAGGWFNSRGGKPVTIKYPDVEDITPEQYNYIKGVFEAMEQDPTHKLHMPSFLKHFLVGEIAGNTDTYWSTYVYKHRSNDTLYVGPTWDHDLSFDNDSRTYPINNKSNWIYQSGSAARNMKDFVRNLVENNGAVRNQLAGVYSYARDHGLSAENLNALVDQLAAEIEPSQQLNFTRWQMLNQYVHMNPRVPQTYADEIAFLKNYITNRFAWVDTKLQYVPSFTEAVAEHESDIVVEKVMVDGQLLIKRGEKYYTLQGVEL